jgi:predicted site-specific integrase-resolvase
MRVLARAFGGANEAAGILGISNETLRRWDKKGRILIEQDSRKRRISAVEADRLS